MFMNNNELNFFNSIASVWDSNEKMSNPDKISRVLDFIGIQKNDKVLDLGTGTGVLLPQLCERVGESGEVTAVDIAPAMLGVALNKNADLTPAPRFLYADFELQHIEGKYNHIILYCVYPHLENPVRTLKKLKNENLLPGGNIVIAFPCSADVINNIHGHNPIDSEKLLSPSRLALFLSSQNLPAKVLAETRQMYIVEIAA